VSDVRVAAAQALRDVGSAAAVLPLKEALDRDRSAPLQKAARESIAAIQSRLHGASPGQLSLTEAQAGQLSLADADPRGRVSISEDA
jgi:HEAT repeat protein